MKEKFEIFSKLMHPIFGYMVAFSWGAQMLSVAFVILFKTNEAAGVINAMESLSTTWAVGLSVLGIYVYRRDFSEKVGRMIWSSNIIYLIKYWKAGGVILLIAAFFISAHLAKSRGEKLDIAEQALETERQKFARQLNQIEKARQNEKERNEFRKSQNRKSNWLTMLLCAMCMTSCASVSETPSANRFYDCPRAGGISRKSDAFRFDLCVERYVSGMGGVPCKFYGKFDG